MTEKTRKPVCSYVLIQTEHKKLLIFETRPGNSFLENKRLEVQNMDIFTYFNSKFIYVQRHIRTEINRLYHDVLTQRCILEQQVFRNTLTSATQSPDEFAYHLMKGPGYMSVIVKVVHIVKCIRVEVKYRKTEACYLQLPIFRGNQPHFPLHFHLGIPQHLVDYFPFFSKKHLDLNPTTCKHPILSNINPTSLFQPSEDQLVEAITYAATNFWHPMLLPDTFLEYKTKKRRTIPFTIPLSMVLPFTKVQYLFDKYLIFTITIPIPSTEEFQLFTPHSIPTYLGFNTDVISSIYMKPPIPYLAISSNEQSYFRTNENFLNASYQNGFQTFCHPPRSISNTNNNPICETSMFLISEPYKCKVFITFSEYPFLTPLQFYHGLLHSTIFTDKFSYHV